MKVSSKINFGQRNTQYNKAILFRKSIVPYFFAPHNRLPPCRKAISLNFGSANVNFDVQQSYTWVRVLPPPETFSPRGISKADDLFLVLVFELCVGKKESED